MTKIPSETIETASGILAETRCALVYDLSCLSEEILNSIDLLPVSVRDGFAEILLLCKQDSGWTVPAGNGRISLFKIKEDLDYGERRKLIFSYAKNKFDYLLIANGDSPLPPELILCLLSELKNKPDALWGLPAGKQEKSYSLDIPEKRNFPAFFAPKNANPRKIDAFSQQDAI